MPHPRSLRLSLRSLRDKAGRREHGHYLAEGIRVLEEALRHGALPKELFVVPERLGERGVLLVRRFRDAGIDATEIDSTTLDRFAEARTPQGAIGVFALPEPRLEAGAPRGFPSILLLDGIADPGNAGTLLRSALAFGFGLAILAGESADPFSPKVVRSSAGAIFGLEAPRVSVEEAAEWVRSAEVPLIATSQDGESPSTEALARRPLVLAIGSEARGLHPELAAVAQSTWRVEHPPAVDSLHAAVAGSILMHEVFRAGSRTGARGP